VAAGKKVEKASKAFPYIDPNGDGDQTRDPAVKKADSVDYLGA